MLKTLIARIGMDKAIFYTISARVVQGIGGLVSILLIARYMSDIEQGFYYTFTSILAIQLFFELGLGGIITQYTAHEKAHLTQEGMRIEGPEPYRSRLASILHFCIRWYSILGIFLWLALTVTGLFFFSFFYKSDQVIVWQIPWILLSFGTTLNFQMSALVAFIEGLGKVREMAKFRLIQQTLVSVSVWIGLYSGAGLYVGALTLFVALVSMVFYLKRDYLQLLRNIYKIKIIERVSYRHEIFPYQWKIAISWISGYFIFQLFNPLLFATEGAVVAGQMGMTLVGLNMIISVSDSWVGTKIPVFSGLIALKNYSALDALYRRTYVQSLMVNFTMCILFIIGIYLLGRFDFRIGSQPLVQRFIPMGPLAVMTLSVMVRALFGPPANYIRCHKQEPFITLSVVSAIINLILMYLGARYYGLMGLVTGYMLVMILSLIYVYRIYLKKKKEWHR